MKKQWKSMKNLAITYGELGDRYKEFKLQEQIYYIRCRVMGEEHPDTVSSLSDIAYLAQLLGEGAKALEFYERLYENAWLGRVFT